MAHVTGVVEYQPRANKNGYWSVKVGGTYYSTGKKDPGVSKGDVVSFEAEQNANGYWDVKGPVTKVSDNAPLAGTKASYTSGASRYERPFPVPPRHGDRTIIRQNALAHATAVVLKTGADIGGDVNTAAHEIIRVAKIFEAYAAGDEERRQDEAKIAARVAAEMAGGE